MLQDKHGDEFAHGEFAERNRRSRERGDRALTTLGYDSKRFDTDEFSL